MQTFDDLDILALLFVAGAAAVFVLAWIVAVFADKHRQARFIAPPDVRVIYGHKRWYRVTTSRVNDRGGI